MIKIITGLPKRWLQGLITFLLAVDCMTLTLACWAIYTFTGKLRPNCRLSISGFVGFYARQRWEWAVVLSDAIDVLMFNPAHCAEAAVSDAAFEAQL